MGSWLYCGSHFQNRDKLGVHMEEQLKKYYTEKPEGDINLVAEVRTLLHKAGLQNSTAQHYDQHPLIHGSLDKISTVQRFNLNRYWSLQLMATDKYSEEERYCLIPNGTNEDWLKLFEVKVMPFILANNLPKAIG